MNVIISRGVLKSFCRKQHKSVLVQMASNSRPKVLITNLGVADEAVDLLRKHCDVIVNEIPTREAILSKIKGVDAILVKQPATIDKELLEAAGPQLKVIATQARGTDFMDIEELKRRNIEWTSLTNQNCGVVADYAIMLLLAASRRAYEGRLAMERSEWLLNSRQWMLGYGTCNSTIGLIGFGSIGQTIVKRMVGFNIKQFLYTGPREKEEAKTLGVKFVPQDTLLRESDFVLVTCPLTEETKNMCNADFFSKMKKSAVFVNVARGAIVDQSALIEALKNRIIFAAGLDVMTPEPLPSEHELMKLPNLILSPHVAYKTENTVKEMGMFAAKNILKCLNVEENY